MKNKDRYDLRELRIIIDRSCDINYRSLKIIHKRKKIFERIGIGDHEIFNEISGWLEQDYSPLDEKEREYLSAVIKPFRSHVVFIRKIYLESAGKERIEIVIEVNSCFHHYMILPPFDKGTMYQGVELDKEYSLEDLGL